jgi:hypothetical protein
MATAASRIVADQEPNSLGSSNAARWDAIFKLAGSAAVGDSPKPYHAMADHLRATLGPTHPVVREFETAFASRLNSEDLR